MSAISQFPTLKNITGTVYVPVIKESSDGKFINYKVTCDSIILNGLTAINGLVGAYINLNQGGNVNLNEYYTKELIEELINLIKSSLTTTITSTESNIVKITLSQYDALKTLKLLDSSKIYLITDLNAVVLVDASKVITKSDLLEAINNISIPEYNTSNLVTKSELLLAVNNLSTAIDNILPETTTTTSEALILYDETNKILTINTPNLSNTSLFYFDSVTKTLNMLT